MSNKKYVDIATEHIYQLIEAVDNDDKNKFLEILREISVVDDIINSDDKFITVHMPQILLRGIFKWIKKDEVENKDD